MMSVLIHQEGGEDQPIFFESGSLGNEGGMGVDGLPEGYLRIPCDLYFRGGGPRMVVDSHQPETARAERSCRQPVWWSMANKRER